MSGLSLHPLEQHLHQRLLEFQPDGPLVVAYSGGLDSSVLLAALAKLNKAGHEFPLSAIHVNHQLHPQADQWQQHCQLQCDSLGIPLQCFAVELDASRADNLEARARQQRYQIFESQLAPGSSLLMAHHQDDQAETLLFRLLRGSGIRGAGAIPAQRRIGKARLLRPLLALSRRQLRDYAQSVELSWVEDPSNQSVNFSRNYLRHKVMPVIAEQWPAYAATLQRFSDVATEQLALLDEVAMSDWRQCATNESGIFVHEMLRMSAARRKNLLHFWARQLLGASPSNKEISQVCQQLEAAQSSAVDISFAGAKVRSYNGELLLVSSQQPTTEFQPCQWPDIQHPLTLSNGITLTAEMTEEAGLRPPRTDEKVMLLPRKGGEKCRPDYRRHSCRLKQIYQELGVPPWRRQWLPLLYYNEHLVAVPGVFISADFVTDEQALKLNLPTSNSLA